MAWHQTSEIARGLLSAKVLEILRAAYQSSERGGVRVSTIFFIHSDELRLIHGAVVEGCCVEN